MRKNFNYLLVDQPKAGRFYLLPKIHKAGNPGRPTVSANGHHTEKISEFVDLHLQPHVQNLPSYLQDTTDFFEETRCPWSVAPRHPPGLHGCNFALHQHTTPRWYPSLRRSLGNTDQQRPTNRNPDQTPYTRFEV